MERENKQEKEEVTYESNKKAESERVDLNMILAVLTENANVLNIAKLNRKQTQSYNFKKIFIITIFCL